MAKFRILGEGVEFHDSWGVNSNDVGAVRVNGNCVERMGKGGNWYTCYNAGRPVEKLLWCENGSVMAVTDDGSVNSANVNLTCNPNNKPRVREYVSKDRSARSASRDRDDDDEKEGFFGPGWWWKKPLKGLWWCTKNLGMLIFCKAMSDTYDKK